MKIFSFGRAKRNQEKLQSFEGDEAMSAYFQLPNSGFFVIIKS